MLADESAESGPDKKRPGQAIDYEMPHGWRCPTCERPLGWWQTDCHWCAAQAEIDKLEQQLVAEGYKDVSEEVSQVDVTTKGSLVSMLLVRGWEVTGLAPDRIWRTWLIPLVSPSKPDDGEFWVLVDELNKAILGRGGVPDLLDKGDAIEKGLQLGKQVRRARPEEIEEYETDQDSLY